MPSRVWLTLAVLCAGAAWGQAPSYSAGGIVNASDYAPGPFAANSVLAVFGTDLSFNTVSLTSDLIVGGMLPKQMGGSAVYVDGSLAPLLYVSPGQINFLIPTTEIAGAATVTVARQGLAGPTVTINLATSAPQLFLDSSGYAIAQDWNQANAVITQSAPAHAGDLIILYATGMGAVLPSTSSGQLAQYASQIVNLSTLQVLVNGTALSPSAILYAGLSPGSAGLYQINVQLPSNTGSNPAIQVSVAGQASEAGQLAVQ